MNLKYMKLLEENPMIGGDYSIKGLDESQIVALEKKYNLDKKFPLVFREYLLIGGEKGGTGVVDNDFDWLHEECEEDLEYCGYSMERPYFVFDRLDGQSSIFYLDEEDEDPKVYILDPYGKKEGEFPLVRPSFISTFSGLINEAIHRIQNDISF